MVTYISTFFGKEGLTDLLEVEGILTKVLSVSFEFC